MALSERIAAVDLGSNSFRLEVGVVEHGQFRRTAYFKETVRQGGGLDAERNLSAAALQAGWDCLARFAEHLQGFRPDRVLAVATQTLREARNREVFLERGSQILGFPISVISGREEARLIYQGVAHTLPKQPERRLVIDVGGRSTELIVGQGMAPQVMESYRVGSIAWSRRFFADGQLGRKAFEVAEVAALAVLDEALDAYHPERWDAAYGSAGTVGAIADVLVAEGWPAGVISLEGLDWLRDKLIAAQHVDRVRLPGMRDDRKPIIGGGVSVMRAVFRLLSIRQMHTVSGGLRTGLLCELMGAAVPSGDVREQSVERLERKFGVDPHHGARVARVALALWNDLLTERADPERERRAHELVWAARLHELGSHIAHSDYHKHGAYVLENAELLGFSLPEQHRLATLVLGHRGKLRKVELELAQEALGLQLLALRLAVILCHARRDPDLGGLQLRRKGRSLHLRMLGDWAERFPQSAHLLRDEAQAWTGMDWSLRVTAE